MGQARKEIEDRWKGPEALAGPDHPPSTWKGVGLDDTPVPGPMKPTCPYILKFDARNDDGPMCVGTFVSREAAFQYVADELAGPGFEASYSAIPLAAPIPRRRRG